MFWLWIKTIMAMLEYKTINYQVLTNDALFLANISILRFIHNIVYNCIGWLLRGYIKLEMQFYFSSSNWLPHALHFSMIALNNMVCYENQIISVLYVKFMEPWKARDFFNCRLEKLIKKKQFFALFTRIKNQIL